MGCDAHKENDLFSRFTWVKADLTFEGLRQICFEPEQRVRIQNDKPDFKEEKLVIEHVKFKSPNNIFSSTPIHLNPNLNVIIGGKSSGKSILLYAIAKTLSADTEILKNEAGKPKYDLKKIDHEFDFEIVTKGGFTQNISKPADENSIIPEIKYIPQNYLVKLAEPELNAKGKSLNKLVRDLILEDNEFSEVYQNFITNVKQFDKLKNTQIDLFFETKDEIEKLENELKKKSNKEVLQKNIETNIAKVEELNKSIGLNSTQVQEYKLIQVKIEDNKTNIGKLKSDFLLIKSFNQEVSQIIKNTVAKRDNIIAQVQLSEIKDYIESAYSILDKLSMNFSEIDSDFELFQNQDGTKSFKHLSKFAELHTYYNNENAKLKESILPFLMDKEVREQIEEINKSISEDKKLLNEIDNLSRKIQETKKALTDTKAEIFNIYENNYREYLNVIEALKSRTIELEKDGLKISGKAQFNFPKLKSLLITISDGRRASYNKFSMLKDDKKVTDFSNFSEILEEVKSLFEEIITGEYAIISRTNVLNAAKIVLNDYFLDYWEIQYKSDKLGEMSTGKASFVILMLIIGLSKSKAPILIDQPEDNLDNRSITNDLVNYLRNKKVERQIILVTHNANIVVNADSENVIVANQKGQNGLVSSSAFKFDYINGSLENSFEKVSSQTDILKSVGIRQHVADIVEGGKDAFIMRERKYRFK